MKRHKTVASFMQKNKAARLAAYKMMIVIMLLSIQSIDSYGQSIYPSGSTPPEDTRAQTVLDTLFNDSLTHLTGGIYRTYPNAVVSGFMIPDTISDPPIWGPVLFQGHTFNLTFQGDPNYFSGFPSQPTLFQQIYTLKVYAPGDTSLLVPVYENDSVTIQMNSATPRVDFRIDLSGVFAKYIPQAGKLYVDSTDTSSYVQAILDSMSVSSTAGTDSITWGGGRICFDSAFRLIDSADMAARGLTYNLLHNRPMYYSLTLNPGSTYTYTGFSTGVLRTTVATSYSALSSSPGRVIYTGSGGSILVGPVVVTTGGGIPLPAPLPIPWPWPGSCHIPLQASSVTTGNPVTYTWKECPASPNYEIQILRLYNTDPALLTDPHYITTQVDWSQALDLETNNSQQSIVLTTAEGSGWYVWRVRGISDAYPNTIGDNLNWGPWSSTGSFTTGATVSVNPSMASPYLFYYDVFDDTLNYIYHRQFVEGEINHGSQLRVGEKTTYANYLLMPVQEQVRAQQADTILASQTIPDNNGRPQLQTLPAPVGKKGFNYEYNYIQNSTGTLFTANDYDQQSNYNHRNLVSGASKLVRYYSNANGDVQIPNSDSVPYTRTLNYNDGLNRPREISSPGKYMSFGSGHTVKKYYGAPASDELIRLFGDEAPASESVLKTYTVDPNQVINISFTDEITGKVLATCLTEPQSTLLDTIPDDKFTVHDTVKAKTVGYSPDRLTETKTYTFAQQTQLSYIYSIVSGIYGDTCVGMCASCDYLVDISCSNVDDTVPSHAYYKRLVIAPSWDSSGGACNYVYEVDSNTYSLVPITGGSPTVLLDPGTYVVTATILLGNTDPLTGIPYITEMDTIMETKLRNRLWNTPGTVIGAIGGAPVVTLTGIWGYLNSNDMAGLLAYTGADTSQPYFKFVVGCDTLSLPTEHCPVHNCSTIDFAEYMVAQLAQYDADNSVTTFSGVTDISMITATVNLFSVNTNAEFDGVIQNMIDSGYNCDTLWNCWTATVTWFCNAQYTNSISFPTAPPADFWQHFMGLVGYKLPFTPVPAAELITVGSDQRKAPFRYFPYDIGSNAAAENTFCYLYTTNYLGGTWTGTCGYTTATWMAAIENFPSHHPSDLFHMYNFYESIKPSSPSYVSSLTTTGTGLSGFGSGSPATYASMTNECYKLCNSKYNDLANQVAQQYMKGGSYIPGYTYPSWDPTPAPDTVTLSHVYCITSALVGKCKAGCTLTPDPTTGLVPPAQILAYEQSMEYTMDFQVSLSDSPTVCAGTLYSYDTTVTVNRDSTHCWWTGAKFQCDTFFYTVDSIYTVITGADTGMTPVCNGDSTFSQNQAMLDWINNRYDQLHDSMAAWYTAVPYNWAFMASAGMGAFGAAGALCTGATIPIDGLGPQGYVSFDTLRTTTSSCSGMGFTVYRTKPRTAFIHSTMHMDMNVVLTSGGGVLAGDSIVVLETVPSTGTIINSNGTLIGSTLHFASGGPLIPGDTLRFSYDIVMPPLNGTNVIMNGQVARYVSGVPSYCTLVADTTVADTCEEMYFNLPGSGVNKPAHTPLCTSCWTPMNCAACVCFHFVPPNPLAATDSVHVFTCNEFVCRTFTTDLLGQMQQIEDAHSNELFNAYNVVCRNPDSIKDMFVNKWSLDEYQWTLYYYDRAGNLIRTVAPQGVRDTATGRYSPPGHYSVTSYDYNTLGQVLHQTTVDGGTTTFMYDKRGKVRLSQNAKQAATSSLSYTKYDNLARVVEAGQVSGYALSGTFPYADTGDLNNQNFPTSGGGLTNTYVTKTVYTTPCPVTFPSGAPSFTGGSFLQNRISYTVTDRDGNFATTNDEVYNMYSYDAHGNADTVIDYIVAAPDPIQLEYRYDLISNKVAIMRQYKRLALGGPYTVHPDYLEQQYSYDGDKRLTKVWSRYSPGTVQYQDAAYSYYLHGPLRRLAVGNGISSMFMAGAVQGMDYTYTLQGWLKAINYSQLQRRYDPGNDSSAASGKDLFGMVLNYYQGDFNRTGSVFNSLSNPLNLQTTSPTGLGGGDLFNGNITSWMSQEWRHPVPSGSSSSDSLFYQVETGATYRYDQLNRIKQNRFWAYDTLHHNWLRPGGDGMCPYDETFTYDKNGNLLKLTRTAQLPPASIQMIDNLTYTYNGGSTPINQLNNIADAATPSPAPPGDFKSTNYTYDAIGELATENTPGSPGNNLTINWTPYGKVDNITIGPASGTPYGTHQYLYDAMGNQVYDLWTPVSGPATTNYSIYDGHNTKLALYSLQSPTTGVDGMQVKERYIYGSERLATVYGFNNYSLTHMPGTVSLWVWGPAYKEYEMHDHLGNIRVTVPSANPGIAGLVSGAKYYNYYAFGSMEPYRRFENPVSTYPSYSFGFNGQERKDDYEATPGAHNHALYWEYDTRTGRRWNLDPKPNASWSNYSAFKDDPTHMTDVNGDYPDWLNSFIKSFFHNPFGSDGPKSSKADDIAAYHSKIDQNNAMLGRFLTQIKEGSEKTESVMELIPGMSSYFDWGKGDGKSAFKDGAVDLAMVLLPVGKIKYFGKLFEMGKSPFPNLVRKFAEHGKEFTLTDIGGYLKRAISMMEAKEGGNIVQHVSKEGWIQKANLKTGEFLVINPDGQIVTFFRRLTGDVKEYFETQVKKYPAK